MAASLFFLLRTNKITRMRMTSNKTKPIGTTMAIIKLVGDKPPALAVPEEIMFPLLVSAKHKLNEQCNVLGFATLAVVAVAVVGAAVIVP